MSLKSNSTKITITAVFLLLAASTLLIVSTRSLFVLASSDHAKPAGPIHTQNPDRIESELITVRPSGFEPVELTRPPGRFNLRLNNRSGVAELQLQLLHERGERLQEVKMAKGRLGWNEFLNLPPGKYMLTEANHPEWVCTITITPR